MVAPAQKIVLSGYYGFRNSGDEAVLQSILNALKRQSDSAGISIEPVVLSIDPEWTSATYGVEAVHRMKLAEVRRAIGESAGLISGGGSLLQDVTSGKSIPYYLGIIKLAQWMGKPTFVYAQGIGPVQRRWFHPVIKSVFRKCAYVSVRDEQSRQLLMTMGLRPSDVQVVPDPVMGLILPEEMASHSSLMGQAAKVHDAEPASAANSSSVSPELPVVGISVRYWEKDRRELDAIVEGLRQVCRTFPVHLRFLPFHLPSDTEASQYCMDRLGGDIAATGSAVSLCEEADHPQKMLREVGACGVLLGMRLHSLIYAAGRRVPLIGISYDPKIDHFLDRINCLPVGTTASLDSAALCGEIVRLLKDGDVWRREKETLIDSLILEAEAPARQIIEYLRHKG
ncbi:polysaccharide pyruvyl transferase CsaB [Paenibacillus sophorae]|uniref:Polysaccharide pyruvyl transferase CsaB n=1 Tax=Paenibacillus sophorae TaxID=1333845 RepID=A0A1H8I8E9_9BACL|nr:polysaccharide pyruvyl transferase CsaB [Paenibacillus sophorae]QWU15888.1 polysaccharide pyruvyl transferase CsaB [Paenibacillus sophorae]SEN64963.1 polysaccharide pyruvyl transferase CsaB [Paenibacillus sophorae]